MPGSEIDHADGAAGHIRKGGDTFTGLRAKPRPGTRRTVSLPKPICLQHGISQDGFLC